MDTPTTQAELLDALAAEHAAWDALIADYAGTRLTAPGAAGTWALIDVVAHLMEQDRRYAELMELGLRGQPYVPDPLDTMPFEARNAIWYARNQGRPAAEILADARASYARIRQALTQVTDAELHDPARFGLPPGFDPFANLVQNVYVHRQAHRQELADARPGHS